MEIMSSFVTKDRKGQYVTIDIIKSAHSVQIKNSHAVTSRSVQELVCKSIKSTPDLPDDVAHRSWRSLRAEWRAHNLAYRLPLLPSGWKERLKDVDFDNEPTWRCVVYFVLSLIPVL